MKTIKPKTISNSALQMISSKLTLALLLCVFGLTGIHAHHKTFDKLNLFHAYDEAASDPMESILSIYTDPENVQVPENNDCTSAIPIQCGEVVSGTTIGATIDGSLINCITGFNGAPGVWYSITGISGIATATTCSETGPLFDTKIGVYIGSCDNLKCVTGNDDAPAESTNLDCSIGNSFFNRASFVEFQADYEETYYIYVSGFLNSSNDFELTLTCTYEFDCPTLNANIGDACDDNQDNTENDMVTEDCECIGTEIVIPFDCEELEANIGDTCDDGDDNTENDLITEDCGCVGTEIVIPFDCEELGANIGDTCDDGDDNTENDQITEDCGCVGTEIVIPFDCEELEGNIGDACDDGDDNTVNDIINVECECQGIVANIDACQDFVYFISDHETNHGNADIYKVTLSNETGTATMSYISTSADEVHIAYNTDQELIYAISRNHNSYRTLDPLTGIWGSEVYLNKHVGQITAAVFNQDGKLLIGSQNQKVIYSVNVSTQEVSMYDKYVPLSGGDLAFSTEGMLYMATRSGNGLYEVWPAPMNDNLIANITPKVTGLAITHDDQLLISAQGKSELQLRNTDGSDPMISFSLLLDGEPYTLRDGDMASGCAGNASTQPTINPFTTTPTHSSLTSFPNPTTGSSKVVFLAGETTQAVIEVYDINGRKVETLFNQEGQKGTEYTLDFNGSTLPNGVYMYRLTTDNETIIEKFLIAR